MLYARAIIFGMFFCFFAVGSAFCDEGDDDSSGPQLSACARIDAFLSRVINPEGRPASHEVAAEFGRYQRGVERAGSLVIACGTAGLLGYASSSSATIPFLASGLATLLIGNASCLCCSCVLGAARTCFPGSCQSVQVVCCDDPEGSYLLDSRASSGNTTSLLLPQSSQQQQNGAGWMRFANRSNVVDQNPPPPSYSQSQQQQNGAGWNDSANGVNGSGQNAPPPSYRISQIQNRPLPPTPGDTESQDSEVGSGPLLTNPSSF